MTIKSFALLTQSPYFPESALERVAAAYRIRAPQVAAAWTPIFPDAVALDVRVVRSLSEITDQDIPVVGSLSIDEPDFLAEHSVKDGRPYGVILCDKYQTMSSMLRAWLHELQEAQVDPSCDRELAGIDVEIVDPVEGSSELITLSDGSFIDAGPFVTGAWYGFGPGPTVSNLMALAPKTCAVDGYFRQADGTEVQGERYVAPSHAHHRHTRRSRIARARGRAQGERLTLRVVHR